MSLVAPTMQMFFTDRLLKQRQASPATVRTYRNAFRLLLRFVQERTGKQPSNLDWTDLGGDTIAAFLDHLVEDFRRSEPGHSLGAHGPPQERSRNWSMATVSATVCPARGSGISDTRASSTVMWHRMLPSRTRRDGALQVAADR